MNSAAYSRKRLPLHYDFKWYDSLKGIPLSSTMNPWSLISFIKWLQKLVFNDSRRKSEAFPRLKCKSKTETLKCKLVNCMYACIGHVAAQLHSVCKCNCQCFIYGNINMAGMLVYTETHGREMKGGRDFERIECFMWGMSTYWAVICKWLENILQEVHWNMLLIEWIFSKSLTFWQHI